MKLSVNLNKVALLRNSRGALVPSPTRAAEACLSAGAHGITLHWRADERHTRAQDVREIRALCRERGAEFNLEGDLRPELVRLAEELVVDQLTLVPVTPGEVTSDHGWDLPSEGELLEPVVRAARARGMRVSLFIDADPERAKAAARTGADRVEIYTEPYAAAFAQGRVEVELRRVRDTAAAARAAGLRVNAGHDLSLRNLPLLARTVPDIEEVSIGHALVGEALYLGLGETVQRYLKATAGETVDAPELGPL